MSRAQRAILTLGALVILAMILFPPWIVSHGLHGGDQFRGYHCLFYATEGHVKTSLLLVQVIATAMIAWLVAQFFKPNK
jgi:uncharacterized membrane protein YjgN (DUF898 family)